MRSKVFFAVCLLFGLMFINAGLNKFLNYIPVPPDLPEKMVKQSAAFLEIGWLLPLVATVEIIGGILFIISKFRPLGAIIIFPVMIGIVMTHITVAPSGLPIALLLLAINLFIIYDNREKYIAMIK
ncbi:MAG TPA: DoxX family protein [bacterium]|nr:DoxX family protein [bacterium]HNF87323.1 DoxX family protein [bacterium]HNI10466.1 DoxX family protein [bacterium]HNJ72294.1 DoxX family protein [bacterium]